jgi:hypothetical protein
MSKRTGNGNPPPPQVQPEANGAATATLEAPPSSPGESRGEGAKPIPGDRTQAVLIELPFVHVPTAYATSNVGDLPRETAQQLRDLADGLAAEGLKLQNGKPITNSREAIIWLFQQTKDSRSR